MKAYCGKCIEGVVILLACIIFSLFASTPPSVDVNASAVTMVLKYLGELIFNMLILVGTIKGTNMLVKEITGL